MKPLMEQTAEGVWIVTGDGKYPQDPARPATELEIEQHQALMQVRELLAGARRELGELRDELIRVRAGRRLVEHALQRAQERDRRARA